MPSARVVKPRRPRIVAAAVACVVLAGFGAAAFAVPTERPRTYPDGSTVYPISMNALVASCDRMVKYPPPPQGEGVIGWLPDGMAFKYQMTPPLIGPFAKVPAQEAVYEPGDPAIPSMGRVVSFLYHGGIVVWYRKDIDPSSFKVLREIAQAMPTETKYLVLPWPDELRDMWQTDRMLIVGAWSRAQPCDVPSSDVFFEFEESLKQDPAPGAGLSWSDPGPKAREVPRGREM